MSTAKTSTERSRKFRQMKAQEAKAEVRGIYAPKDLHDEIKKAAYAIVQKAARSGR